MSIYLLQGQTRTDAAKLSFIKSLSLIIAAKLGFIDVSSFSVLPPFVPCNTQPCIVAGIICAKQCATICGKCTLMWQLLSQNSITCSTEIQPIAVT